MGGGVVGADGEGGGGFCNAEDVTSGYVEDDCEEEDDV